MVRYLAETSHKASQSDDRTHLRWVDRFLDGVGWRGSTEICWTGSGARKQEGVANCHSQSHAGSGASDAARAAYEWDWIDQGAAGSDAAGTKAAHALVDARGGRPSDQTAGAPGGDGEVLPGDRVAKIQRHRPAVVTGGLGAALCVDSCRPGQSAKGNCGTAECAGGDRDA